MRAFLVLLLLLAGCVDKDPVIETDSEEDEPDVPDSYGGRFVVTQDDGDFKTRVGCTGADAFLEEDDIWVRDPDSWIDVVVKDGLNETKFERRLTWGDDDLNDDPFEEVVFMQGEIGWWYFEVDTSDDGEYDFTITFYCDEGTR